MKAGEKETIHSISIGDLKEVENSRKIDDGKEMADLVESVRAVGILSPIIVAPNAETGEDQKAYVIIAGHRRFHAARAANLTHVPAIIRSMTDEEKAYIQATENIHRKQLNPIEEARALAILLKEGDDFAAAASVIKKSAAYVERSIRLLDLPSDIIKAIEDGEITAAHGHQFFRAGKNDWPKIVKYALEKNWAGRCPTVEDLKTYIDTTGTRDLNAAPWKMTADFSGIERPKCSDCQLNSKNQASLFEGSEAGLCHDARCYDAKMKMIVSDKEELIASGMDPRMVRLGVIRRPARYARVGKHLRIQDSQVDTPTIRNLMREKPEAFGWGVFHDDGKTTKFIVCIDESVLPKQMRPPEPSDDVDWRMRNHVRRAIGRELLLQLAEKTAASGARAMKRRMETEIKDIVTAEMSSKDDETCELLLDLAGIENSVKKSKRKIERIDHYAALHLLWLSNFSSRTHTPEAFKPHIDVDEIVKRITPIAEAEYRAQVDGKKVDTEKKKW